MQKEKMKSNIIEFKKPINDARRVQQEYKEDCLYDAIFTPELHKELLAQARKDYERQ